MGLPWIFVQVCSVLLQLSFFLTFWDTPVRKPAKALSRMASRQNGVSSQVSHPKTTTANRKLSYCTLMAQSPKTSHEGFTRNTILWLYNLKDLRFWCRHYCSSVKHGVLILVNEIRRYRNDRYYYYYYLLSSQVRLPSMKTVQPIRSHLPAW